MKRLAKILASILAIVIVLIIVAAIALPLLFDPNEHKAEIAGLIEQRIGRDVSIPGDIELSVFPWLGISIGKVTVANAPAFGNKPLAEIAAAQVRVKLLPLLHKEIQIGTVSLQGLRLRLARNAKGQTNWGSIVEHLSSAQEAESAGPEKPPQEPANDGQGSAGGGFELASLQIGSVVIEDAAVSWNDAMTGTSYQLTDFHLTTGTLAEDQPFELQAGATLASATQGMTGKFSLSTTIHPDMSAGVYRFDDLKAQLQAEGKAIPGQRQKAVLTTHGIVNLTAGQMVLNDMHIQVAGLDVSGEIRASQLQQSPQFGGNFEVARFDPRTVLGNLGMTAPRLQGDDALSSAELEIAFEATASSAQVTRLRVMLDGSVFTGSAQLRNFSAPVIAFDANVNQFNLDHYLPVASAQQTTDQSGSPNKSTGKKSGAPTKVDLSFLRELTLDGKLHVGTLTAYDMTFNDAAVAVSVRDGVLVIKPLESGFYDGTIHVVAKVDASHAVPQYSLQAKLNKLKFAPLLQDLVGTDLVSALANLKLDLTSNGATVAAIKQALDGVISFDLSDGTLHGFNLAHLIATARSSLAGGDAAPATGTAKTPFSHLAGTFNINGGVLSGDGLSLDTKYLGAVGKGQYDWLANQLDYDLDIKVDKNSAGPLAEIAGLVIPLHLSGSLFSPQYSIDMAAAVKALAKQHLQDEKAELKQKLQKKLSEQLGDKADDKLQKKLQEELSNLFN